MTLCKLAWIFAEFLAAAASSCPATCYKGTCDYWDGGFWGTCASLESAWGCDCGGCDCDGCPQGKCGETPFSPLECHKAGNGMCDADMNTEGCAWDGGDCCSNTCVGTLCGSRGYDCRNPEATDSSEGEGKDAEGNDKAFSKSQVNSNNCPSEFQRIETASDCELAAHSLGLRFERTESISWSPRDCYSYDALSIVFFNLHPTGSASKDYTPICQSKDAAGVGDKQETSIEVAQGEAFFKSQVKSNGCPNEHESIKASSDCEVAAHTLGLRFERTESISWSPRGCYSYDALSIVFFNLHPTGSASEDYTPICHGKGASEEEPCVNDYDLGILERPWDDFVSCAEEAAYCQDHPATLMQHCKKTCDVCKAAPSDIEKPVACTAPRQDFSLPAKSCPTGGVESCLNGNAKIGTFSEAWASCSVVSDCGAITKDSEGNFFLRRATDPDMMYGVGGASTMLFTGCQSPFTSFGVGPCRGMSANHNPSSWYSRIAGFRGDLTDCQVACSSSPACKAIEFLVGSTCHCELWTREPQATLENSAFVCMKKQVTSGNTSATDATAPFQLFGSGPCRGVSANHNPSSWYSRMSDFSGDLTDCQIACISNPACKAIEFLVGSTGHCELWMQEPQATQENVGFTCMKKQAGAHEDFELGGSGLPEFGMYEGASSGFDLFGTYGADDETSLKELENDNNQSFKEDLSNDIQIEDSIALNTQGRVPSDGVEGDSNQGGSADEHDIEQTSHNGVSSEKRTESTTMQAAGTATSLLSASASSTGSTTSEPEKAPTLAPKERSTSQPSTIRSSTDVPREVPISSGASSTGSTTNMPEEMTTPALTATSSSQPSATRSSTGMPKALPTSTPTGTKRGSNDIPLSLDSAAQHRERWIGQLTLKVVADSAESNLTLIKMIVSDAMESSLGYHEVRILDASVVGGRRLDTMSSSKTIRIKFSAVGQKPGANATNVRMDLLQSAVSELLDANGVSAIIELIAFYWCDGSCSEREEALMADDGDQLVQQPTQQPHRSKKGDTGHLPAAEGYQPSQQIHSSKDNHEGIDGTILLVAASGGALLLALVCCTFFAKKLTARGPSPTNAEEVAVVIDIEDAVDDATAKNEKNEQEIASNSTAEPGASESVSEHSNPSEN